MRMTETARNLMKLRKENKEPEINSPEYELASCMGNEGFDYALFYGGYIKPEEWIVGDDLEKLREAIEIVTQFRELVEQLHDEL